jgi:hypothetical protein
MRLLIVIIAIVLAAAGAFAYVEQKAAPTIAARAKNPALCQQACGPHCTKRWGASTLAVVPRQGCFLTCTNLACRT